MFNAAGVDDDAAGGGVDGADDDGLDIERAWSELEME